MTADNAGVLYPVAPMGVDTYAVVIDNGYEAAWLRDLCRAKAQTHFQRAANATKRLAVRENMDMHECFAKYAERFEYIRKQEADRVTTSLGLEP